MSLAQYEHKLAFVRPSPLARGMSPGSLDQFFPNTDAVAEALATRYLVQLHAAQRYSFAPEIAQLPLDALIDRVVDPW